MKVLQVVVVALCAAAVVADDADCTKITMGNVEKMCADVGQLGGDDPCGQEAMDAVAAVIKDNKGIKFDCSEVTMEYLTGDELEECFEDEVVPKMKKVPGCEALAECKFDGDSPLADHAKEVFCMDDSEPEVVAGAE